MRRRYSNVFFPPLLTNTEHPSPSYRNFDPYVGGGWYTAPDLQEHAAKSIVTEWHHSSPDFVLRYHKTLYIVLYVDGSAQPVPFNTDLLWWWAEGDYLFPHHVDERIFDAAR